MRAKPEEVLLSAFHETRRAYQKTQFYSLLFGSNREPEGAIRKLFFSYHFANDTNEDEPRYLEQEIEKTQTIFQRPNYADYWFLENPSLPRRTQMPKEPNLAYDEQCLKKIKKGGFK